MSSLGHGKSRIWVLANWKRDFGVTAVSYRSKMIWNETGAYVLPRKHSRAPKSATFQLRRPVLWLKILNLVTGATLWKKWSELARNSFDFVRRWLNRLGIIQRCRISQNSDLSQVGSRHENPNIEHLGIQNVKSGYFQHADFGFNVRLSLWWRYLTRTKTVSRMVKIQDSGVQFQEFCLKNGAR